MYSCQFLIESRFTCYINIYAIPPTNIKPEFLFWETSEVVSPIWIMLEAGYPHLSRPVSTRGPWWIPPILRWVPPRRVPSCCWVSLMGSLSVVLRCWVSHGWQNGRWWGYPGRIWQNGVAGFQGFVHHCLGFSSPLRSPVAGFQGFFHHCLGPNQVRELWSPNCWGFKHHPIKWGGWILWFQVKSKGSPSIRPPVFDRAGPAGPLQMARHGIGFFTAANHKEQHSFFHVFSTFGKMMGAKLLKLRVLSSVSWFVDLLILE